MNSVYFPKSVSFEEHMAKRVEFRLDSLEMEIKDEKDSQLLELLKFEESLFGIIYSGMTAEQNMGKVSNALLEYVTKDRLVKCSKIYDDERDIVIGLIKMILEEFPKRNEKLDEILAKMEPMAKATVINKLSNACSQLVLKNQ
jgi:hypothetical protein